MKQPSSTDRDPVFPLVRGPARSATRRAVQSRRRSVGPPPACRDDIGARRRETRPPGRAKPCRSARQRGRREKVRSAQGRPGTLRRIHQGSKPNLLISSPLTRESVMAWATAFSDRRSAGGPHNRSVRRAPAGAAARRRRGAFAEATTPRRSPSPSRGRRQSNARQGCLSPPPTTTNINFRLSRSPVPRSFEAASLGPRRRRPRAPRGRAPGACLAIGRRPRSGASSAAGRGALARTRRAGAAARVAGATRRRWAPRAN